MAIHDQENAGVLVEVDHPERSFDTDKVKAVVEQVLSGHGASVEYLAIVLTHSEAVHELNRKYLGHDFPTDVISFPLDDSDTDRQVVNGEVYIDLDMAAERAPEFDSDFGTETLRYAVHGLLHLLGYDDATDEQRAEMRLLEDRYLRSTGNLG